MNEGLTLAAQVVGVTLGFPLVAGFFGWSVLGRFAWLDREERFIAGWGVSFAFLAFAQFLAFVTDVPQPLFAVCVLVLMLTLALLGQARTARQRTDPGPGLWPLAALCGLAYLHLVCVQALLPNYRGSSWYFDWWMHYDEALVFVGQRSPVVGNEWVGYTLASRTPLFNLVMASVMSLAGSDFAVCQLASALTNCCFIAAVYLVLRDLFGPRAGWLGLLLAPLNLWMLHNAWYTWPKMLAAYYLLLGLHFYLRSLRLRAFGSPEAPRLFFCFGVSAFLGYMTHQVSLVYVLPLLLHAAIVAIRRRTYRPRAAELALLVLTAGLIIAPWYAWLAIALGPGAISGSTPVTVGNEAVTFGPWHVLGWVASNTWGSLAPRGLGQTIFRGPLTFADLYDGATELYFSLLTGALTLSVCAFLGWSALRRLQTREQPGRPPGDRSEWAAVWLFILLGWVGAAALHPGKIRHGIAHSAGFPTALVLAALAWGLLSRTGRRPATIVCCGYVTELLLMFWSHWWLLVYRPDVLEPLPGNEEIKQERNLLFLNDRLGPGQYAFLAGAVLIQLALALLLIRSARRSHPATT